MMNQIIRSIPLKFNEQALLADNNAPDRVQVLRTGTFFAGDEPIQITQDILKQMVKNFSENVRGVDLMIDYGHDSEGEAAAWITNLFLNEDETELWAQVDWTEKGQDQILSKNYRYLSADFHTNYKDNETLKEYGHVLFGAGLTNRPFVKNMEPVVQLSEQKYIESEDNMEEVLKQLKDIMVVMEGLKGAIEDLKPKEMMEGEKEEMGDDEMKLSEEIEKQKAESKRLSEENAKMKKENEFNKLFAEGKVVEAQREAFMNNDMAKFSELACEVQFSEKGNQGKEQDKKELSEEEAIAKITKIAKEENITFSEVLKKEPKLKEAYYKSVEL